MSEQDDQSELEARAELRAKYAETIKRLWTERPDTCPVCGSDWWNIGDLVDARVRHVSEFRGWDAIAGHVPQVYVYAPLTCYLCGYTLFFHTGVLDVRAQEEVKTRGPIYGPGSSYATEREE